MLETDRLIGLVVPTESFDLQACMLYIPRGQKKSLEIRANISSDEGRTNVTPTWKQPYASPSTPQRQLTVGKAVFYSDGSGRATKPPTTIHRRFWVECDR
jgi:hypothetical protein